MKKSLSLIVAIAMVFSMFASMVSAAETTAAPTTAQEKFEFLKEKKIFEGINDAGDAGLDQDMTRAQVAKILVLLAGLTENEAGAAVYTDIDDSVEVWAKGFIGAATLAKLMEGTAEGIFDPEATFTTEELATVLVRALDLDLVTDAVEGEVSDWAEGYVATALKNGLIDESDDYTTPALREVLVTSAYNAYVKLSAPEVPAVDVQATGAKIITVTFDKAVDTTKAVFKVTRGTSTTALTPTLGWNDAKTVATLTFGAKFTTADYNVEVSGVVDPAFKKTLSLTDEKVVSIEFPADTVALVRPEPVTLANTNVQVETTYKVYNQYKEEVNNVLSSSNFQASKGSVAEASKGYLRLSVSGSTYQQYNLNESIMISANYSDYSTGSYAQTQKTFKVGAISRVAEVEIVGATDTAGAAAAPVLGDVAENYKLQIVAKDQYGNEVTKVRALQEDVKLFVSNPTIFNIASTSYSSSPVNAFTVDDGKVYVKLDGSQTTSMQPTFKNAGKNTVTGYGVFGTKNATFDLTVSDSPVISTFSIGVPEVAAGGEEITVPYTAVDKSGKELGTALDYKVLKDITLTSSLGTGKLAFVQDHVNNKTNLILDATAFNGGSNPGDLAKITKDAPYIVNLTATVNGSTIDAKFVNTSFSIKENARPVAITDLKDTKRALVNGQATTTVEYNDIVVLDQYDRTYSLNSSRLGKTAGKYYVKAVLETGAAATSGVVDGKPWTQYVDPTIGQYVTLNKADIFVASTTATTDGVITMTSAATDIRGNDRLRLSVVDGGTDKEIINSEKSFALRIVKPEDVVDFDIPDVAKLYAFDAANVPAFGGNTLASYAKSLTVNGVLSDGTKAGIKVDDGRLYTVTSATYVAGVTEYGVNYNLAGSGKLSADIAVLEDGLLKDASEAKLSVTVSVVKSGTTPDTVTKEVTVSKATPVPTTFSVQAGTASLTAFTTPGANVIKAPKAAFTTDVDAFVNAAVKVVDQYGVTAVQTSKFSKVTVFNLLDASGEVVRDGTGAIVTGSNILTAAQPGHTFQVTVSGIVNGATYTFKVVVQ
ncbi:MAG: hypothetical protein K0R57_6367 [Paenibacillaceae bacterium]|nr:hypothetical protein [Paenibacillaceae bacterium]